MIRAYNESYLDDAMDNLGTMLAYASITCECDADEFFWWFIQSGIAEQFGNGNPKYLAGMSGAELAQDVVFKITGEKISKIPDRDYTVEATYWAGWAIAYYQWYTSNSFKTLYMGGLTISKVLSMYILHEADISKFVESANEILGKATGASKLKMLRQEHGITQQKEIQETNWTN